MFVCIYVDRVYVYTCMSPYMYNKSLLFHCTSFDKSLNKCDYQITNMTHTAITLNKHIDQHFAYMAHNTHKENLISYVTALYV